LLEKISQLTLPFPSRQPPYAVPQLMPGDARHRATAAMLPKVLQHADVRFLLDDSRDRARVEQILRHSSTVRPAARSRDFSNSSASSPKTFGSLPRMNAS